MTLPLLLNLCLLLPTAPEGEGPKPAKAPDLQPENALQRIRQRNLFHPTRGVVPAGSADAAAAPQAKWPALVGTTMAGKLRFALLRWSGEGGTLSVEKGETQDGIQVVAVEAERVQLRHLATDTTTWLSLEQGGETKAAAVSEFQALLAPPKPAPPKAAAMSAK